ncbi:unnamed protein product [Blepharisma stoltei]|uniref:Uncharacterized protein n=1 Tax=Blepharisma stoltei TaxID=1481888 RepID=A0AAU9J0S5_9CILI|nr:unnamed protein product [Blepharisma stoltei]
MFKPKGLNISISTLFKNTRANETSLNLISWLGFLCLAQKLSGLNFLALHGILIWEQVWQITVQLIVLILQIQLKME